MKEMNGSQFKPKSRNQNALIIIFIGIAISASLIDVAIDAFVYHYGSFWEVLVSSSPGIIFGRIYIAVSFVTIGIFMNLYVRTRAKLTQKRAREEVEASEKRYQTLCDEGRFVMLRMDLKGTVKYVNKVIEAVGMRKEDVIGSNMLKFIPVKKRLKMFNVHLGVIRGNNAEGETELITPKGKRIVEYASNPIREDGKIVGCETLIRDITEKKEMEGKLQEYAAELEKMVEVRTIELKKSQEKLVRYSHHLEELVEEKTRQLRHVERVATIGEFAAMVGHDLRNPLQGIANATYYLKRKSGLRTDDKARELLEIVESDIEYSNKIVDDLIEYSRETQFDLTETTPGEIIRETLSHVELPERIQIIDLTHSDPKIEVDAQKMRRVFLNIIKNAIDVMPEGGILTIKSEKSGDNIKFAFSDTGTGMSKETLGKLWTPLFTTKARGMGFGLSICKRIVQAHGGEISADSVFGKGSTFTVTIPIKPTIENEKALADFPEQCTTTVEA